VVEFWCWSGSRYGSWIRFSLSLTLGDRHFIQYIFTHQRTALQRPYIHYWTVACGLMCNNIDRNSIWGIYHICFFCPQFITAPYWGFWPPSATMDHFRTEQGHCCACRRKWRLTDADLCPCFETQTMFHIVESCPLTKLNGGLSQLHSADEDAVSWLTSYGSWHAYEKKKKNMHIINVV